MIRRNNWRASKEYLKYRQEVDGISAGSLKVEKNYVRYILIWAQETSFLKANDIRPTLQDFLLFNRLDGKDEPLSSEHMKKIMATARRLFTWLVESKKGFRSIPILWIKTLKPRRIPIAKKETDAVSYEEMLEIASAPTRTTLEERTKAAVVFLYISGIRISAFISLPIMSVNIDKKTVDQFPELGVRTKYGKRKTTHLLNIPIFLEVVGAWDRKVRNALPENGYWFAPLSFSSGEIDNKTFIPGNHRHNIARRNIKIWLESVDLPYHSPHAFRHGHIHYGMKNSSDMADFKAVSLNVMHETTAITDRVYSQLKDDEVGARIESFGQKEIENGDSIALEIEEFLKWRKQKRRSQR